MRFIQTKYQLMNIPKSKSYFALSTETCIAILLTVVLLCTITVHFMWPTIGGRDLSTEKITSSNESRKLVCYYSIPSKLNSTELYPDQIDATLCTHINVGIVMVEKNQIVISESLDGILMQMNQLKRLNENLKILLWIGGPSDSSDFQIMIKNHSTRKKFIRSVIVALKTYNLDGMDLDWEFPAQHDKERLHFSQLLIETKIEYAKNQPTFLLSIAVAAPEGIAYFAYDVNIINQYCDYVNIMTYDYHFYAESSPFTGLNAPLYRRYNEYSIMATLNINSSVYFWYENGLDKSKIIVGIPTYGHSFSLVNPFNRNIGSPANGYGKMGKLGFVTYSDVCSLERHHFFVHKVFDDDTKSPYISAGIEWISYEDSRSVACKTDFINENGFGGAMMFSLNTDDYANYCRNGKFSLTNVMKSHLFV